MQPISFFSKLSFDTTAKFVPVKTALIKFFYDKGFYFDVKAHLSEIFDDFTFNKMISLWAGYPIELLIEPKVSLDEAARSEIALILENKELDLSDENGGMIGRIYEATIPQKEKKKGGITYTPEDICEIMKDMLRGKLGKSSRLIDPACGCGVFLEAFYDCLMEEVCSKDSEEKISEVHTRILSENIFGCDTSEISCAIAKIVLALKYNKFSLCPNIICTDSLISAPKSFYSSFDYVVSNPPYIGHKNMTADYRKKIASMYDEVYYDKADLSYCFFILGYKLLKKGGTLLYLTSRYFAQSKFAYGLRSFILEHFSFETVIDFFGMRPFKHTGIDPMILRLKKDGAKESFQAVKFSSNSPNDLNSLNHFAGADIIQVLPEALSSEGFNFLNDEQQKITQAVSKRAAFALDDIVDFFQGIITGCDKAFVVNEGSLLYKECIEECGRKWIKSRNIGQDTINFDGKYVLYTNSADDIREYPHTEKKLEFYKSILLKRRECANGLRKWYELQWGRKEELFTSEKVVFPYKCSENRFVTDKEGYFFSADIYGFALKEQYKDALDINKLVALLNSDIYNIYFKSFAKKLGGTLYEYYPNTVSRILLPCIDDINSLNSPEDIEKLFY